MTDPIGILERLGAGFALLGDRLPKILADPRAYPRETMVLALIVAVTLLIIALVVVTAMGVVRDSAERARLRVRRRPGLTRRRLFIGSALVLLVLALMALLPSWSATSPACGACHATRAGIAAWREDVHASVGCFGCHAQPGVFGAWQASAAGFASLISERPRPPVSDGTCIRCHAAITRGSLESNGIRVRHSDIIESGGTCLSCHAGVGHATGVDETRTVASRTVAIVRPVMSRCLHCHDGSVADAECVTCHINGKPSDSDETRVPMGVTAAPVTCKGCHSARTDRSCVECHGLVLPHPPAFAGQHAGVSYSDPALCAKCHETAKPTRQDACACHDVVNLHGTYSQWFPVHGSAAAANGRGGCRCHAVTFCGFCHESDPYR